nr:phosphoribosyltransferase family protein [Entomoplasma sp. MP1]
MEFVLGDILDKHCFIIDDMIDTGGTIINAAKALKIREQMFIYLHVMVYLTEDQQRKWKLLSKKILLKL